MINCITFSRSVLNSIYFLVLVYIVHCTGADAGTFPGAGAVCSVQPAKDYDLTVEKG